MKIIYNKSCFYRREYFILLDSFVIIDMRLFFFAEFDETVLHQSSIKTVILVISQFKYLFFNIFFKVNSPCDTYFVLTL